MKLKKVTAKRTSSIYCGPTAIATITGRSIECVEQWINFHRCCRLDKIVRYMLPSELFSTLREFGYTYDKSHPYVEKPTFAKWLRERKNRNELCIIYLTDHFVVVKGNKMIDNITMQPTFIRQAPHRRSRVIQYWVIGEMDTDGAGKLRRKRSDFYPSSMGTLVY